MEINEIAIEILKGNREEHFKFSKDLGFIYPPGHPKRIKVDAELNKIQKELYALENEDTGNIQH